MCLLSQQYNPVAICLQETHIKDESKVSFKGYTPYYPRTTRCGGDIVTLLWVRPSVCGSVRPSVRGPCEHNRDYTVACFFVKLGRHVMRGRTLLILEVKGQGHNGHIWK